MPVQQAEPGARDDTPTGEGEGAALMDEDFSSFRVGPFPADYTPLGEYHCVVPAGYSGIWTELTIHHSWRRSMGWNVGEDRGRKHLEHAAQRAQIPSLLATGDPLWSDGTLECEVDCVALRGRAGVAFRLVDSQRYYALLFDADEGTVCLVRATYDDCLIELAAVAAPPIVTGRHSVRLRLEGARMHAAIDGQVELSAEDDAYRQGRVALVAWAPMRYYRIGLRAPAAAVETVAVLRSQESRAQAERAERLPRPVLWRSFDLGAGACSRAIRFGDVDGDGELEMLMAQCVQRGGSDNIAGLTCLTACKLNGETLWQIGEPNREHGVVTADLPVQLHDIDGDGALEAVYCKDFMLRVVDGRSGALKYEAPTPLCSVQDAVGSPDNIFARLNGDALFFADLSGSGTRREILVKNRYGRIWALDRDLRLLWSHSCPTGHSPYVADIDGDGRDEVLVGSTLLDAQGQVLWHWPTNDHVDTAAIIKLAEDAAPIVILASSDDGLYFLSLDGRLIRNETIGHAQDLAVGRFRDDRPGLQFWTKTFWGHPGVVFMYSATLERMVAKQQYPLGSQVYPINWDGGPLRHILLSAHPSWGGVMDGWGRQTPILPDDGHPWMCCEALDVTGDSRDEILCWDLHRFCIYTQDRPAEQPPHPLRRDISLNFTNYGCHQADSL
jgi:rhamnogalacturonan endolyase